MTIGFDKIISSRTFQFLVGDGPTRKLFTIHTAVVEDHSAPLAALMNGLMSEAADGIATLEDTDEQTFVRFCEYAYTGDYAPVQLQPVLAASQALRAEIPTSVAEELEDIALSPEIPKKRQRMESSVSGGLSGGVGESRGQSSREAPLQSLWNKFKRRHYTPVSPKFRPRGHTEEFKDNAGPFLCHARVYVFADRYDIAGLRAVALDKLHQALCFPQFDRNYIEELVDLVKFSYSNENTRDNEAGQAVDPLRNMILIFVVCVFKVVVNQGSFIGLVGEGGYFARDLTRLLGHVFTGDEI